MTNDPPASLTLQLGPNALRPLIREIVAEVLAQVDADHAQLAKEIYSEAEAAQFLGINEWSLRDERKRGRIIGSQIVGRRIRYSREDLMRYLAARRTDTLTER